MTIAVECKYVPQDYVRSQYLHMKPRRWLYFFVLGFFGILIVLTVAANYLVPSAGREPRTHSAMPISFATRALLLAAIAYLFTFFYLYIPRRARRLFAQTKELHSPVRFSFSDEGMAVEHANGQSAIPWNHILKWREDRHLFLLYPNDILFLFYMIPKRCVADETVLAALLNSHVKRSG